MIDRETECEAIASRLRSLTGSLRIVLACAQECEENAEHLTAAIFLTSEIETELEQGFRSGAGMAGE